MSVPSRPRWSLRHAALAAWGIVGTLAPLMLGPIEGSVLSALIVYGGPILVGVVAGYVGSGVNAFLAFAVGLVIGHVLVGIIAPPDAGEAATRVARAAILLGLAFIGYGSGALLRSISSRRSATQ